MDEDKNMSEIISDIHDGYKLVKTAKDVVEYISDEYNDMIENMDTKAVQIFINNVIINDSYM